MASDATWLRDLDVEARATPYPGGALFGEEERVALDRVLSSGVLSGFVASPGDHHLGGPEVRALEAQWAELGSYRHVVAVNSATAGLHAGVVAMELPKGGEVIVPPLTMSATIAAVRMAGCEPVFADLDPELFVLTAATIEPAITERTVGIVVVHLFGQLAPMGPIRELAARHGLKVLEDAAQAPGATQDGEWPGHGTCGAVFSFNQNKTITCGEGGLLVTDDDRVAAIARLVRNHAESVVHDFPDIDAEGLVGWNYRPTELDAAVARCQTDRLTHLTEWRRGLAEQFTATLDGIDGLRPPVVHPGNRHVWFTYPARFDAEAWGVPRETVVAALQEAGIPCAPGYVQPLYGLPLFGDHGPSPDGFPATERIARQELINFFVCRWPATSDDIGHAGEVLHALWSQRDRLAER